jgi:Mg2+-importing ATPase
VRVKVLSGDDPLVVARVAGLVGLTSKDVLAGPELAKLSEDAFRARVQDVDLYGRLTPDQKVRVVRALQARGETVGSWVTASTTRPASGSPTSACPSMAPPAWRGLRRI